MATEWVVGVGGVLIEDGKVLLVRRRQSPAKGSWSIPGGRVENGESLDAAVSRELREETGYDVVVQLHLETVDVPGPDRCYRVHDYLCQIVGGELRAGDDAADAAWFDPQAVGTLGVTRAVARVIAHAFTARRLRASSC